MKLFKKTLICLSTLASVATFITIGVHAQMVPVPFIERGGEAFLSFSDYYSHYNNRIPYDIDSREIEESSINQRNFQNKELSELVPSNTKLAIKSKSISIVWGNEKTLYDDGTTKYVSGITASATNNSFRTKDYLGASITNALFFIKPSNEEMFARVNKKTSKQNRINDWDVITSSITYNSTYKSYNITYSSNSNFSDFFQIAFPIREIKKTNGSTVTKDYWYTFDFYSKTSLTKIIYDQNKLENLSYQTSNLAKSGCGLVALHNLAILTGKSHNFYSVYSQFQNAAGDISMVSLEMVFLGGPLVSVFWGIDTAALGQLGATPKGVQKYLDQLGIKYNPYESLNNQSIWNYLFGQNNGYNDFKNDLNKHNFAIMLYRTGGAFSGAHYVAIQRTENKYKVYNSGDYYHLASQTDCLYVNSNTDYCPNFQFDISYETNNLDDVFSGGVFMSGWVVQ